MSTITSTLLWLRQDLRLTDNPALTWAAAQGPLVPIYILDTADQSLMGAASKWWLHEALKDLQKSFLKLDIKLILRRGSPEIVLRDLIQATGARSITWTQCFEPSTNLRDKKLTKSLIDSGYSVKIFDGYTLFEPGTILTANNTPFKVYTPFSRACFSKARFSPSLPAPVKIGGVADIVSDKLEDFHLIPQKATWISGLASSWKPTEQAAHDQLQSFLDSRISSYKSGRDRPDQDCTSRLSPYLHFGQISVRQVWQIIQNNAAHHPARTGHIECYLNELLWREFSWHLVHQIPSMLSEPLNPMFSTFPWRQDTSSLRAWQKGQTGFPFIDAGMRQLWQTGWMHNRVRMVVASFLIKDLLIHWREGMAWFWDTLVDADLGSNTASWQWVAGCGADAAPYFRVFNPILQGQKFDPDGHYVRKYIPELQKLDTAYIHEPWKAPPSILDKAGIALGTTYPFPIVDHQKARERALAALKSTKHGGMQHTETKDLFD